MDETTERARRVKATQSIQALTGEYPLGWYTGGDSPNTRRFRQRFPLRACGPAKPVARCHWPQTPCYEHWALHMHPDQISRHQQRAERVATLARTASLHHPADYLWHCPVVTNLAPCAICTDTVYRVNIGRIAYDVSEQALLALTSLHAENPTLSQPCREVIARGQQAIEVIGPVATVQPKMVARHRNFQSRQ